jgi:hypothetical protein
MKTFGRVLILAVVIFTALTVMLGWSIFAALSALLTATTLVLVRDGLATQSKLFGFLTIAWMYWGLSYVSNLIEAVYFTVIPKEAAGSAALAGLIMALVIAGLLETLTASEIEKPLHQVAWATGAWWRIPVLAFVFFFIYLAAGIAIHPWIASFYAHRQLPTLTQLLRLQLCRGVLDVAFMYPVYRQWRKSRSLAAWVSACVFTVLCGWGPLLLPNQFMPGSIRLAHAAEMGASGIAFGIITATALLKTARPAQREAAPPELGRAPQFVP